MGHAEITLADSEIASSVPIGPYNNRLNLTARNSAALRGMVFLGASGISVGSRVKIKAAEMEQDDDSQPCFVSPDSVTGCLSWLHFSRFGKKLPASPPLRLQNPLPGCRRRLFFENLTKNSRKRAHFSCLPSLRYRSSLVYTAAHSRLYTRENASNAGQCRLKRSFKRRAELTSRAAR